MLRGDWLTQGPAVERFEAALCSVTGAEHAVALREPAPSRCTRRCGRPASARATPSRRHRCRSSPARAARCGSTRNRRSSTSIRRRSTSTSGTSGAATRSCAVHYAGLPIDLAGARRPAARGDRGRRARARRAHARRAGRATARAPTRACSRSTRSRRSRPVKVARSPRTRSSSPRRLRRFRSHGMVPRPEHGGWFYEISELTPNARISDLQCALGASQLTKLERFVTRRNELARRYQELLADLDVETAPTAPAGSRHAYHLYPVRVPRRAPCTRRCGRRHRRAGALRADLPPPALRTARRRPVGLSRDRAGLRRTAVAPDVPGTHRPAAGSGGRCAGGCARLKRPNWSIVTRPNPGIPSRPTYSPPPRLCDYGHAGDRPRRHPRGAHSRLVGAARTPPRRLTRRRGRRTRAHPASLAALRHVADEHRVRSAAPIRKAARATLR